MIDGGGLYQQAGVMKTISSGLTCTLLLISSLASAQKDSIANQESSTQIKLGLYYNSHLNYLGRTDSLQSSAFFPMAEVWFGKGFYINAAPVFVNNAVSSFEYAGTVATAGYRFSNKANKFGGNIFVVKPFYKENSQLVQSALKGQFSSNFTFTNKIISITGGGDLRFSDKVDYGATAGLDHVFRIEPGNDFILVVDPSVYAYAGTQNFTRTYFKQTNFLIFPGTEEQITERVNRFSLLSYEFSVPVVLAKGKFQLIANPAYVMPQNLIQVEGRPDLSERGKNLFYITLGSKVIF